MLGLDDIHVEDKFNLIMTDTLEIWSLLVYSISKTKKKNTYSLCQQTLYLRFAPIGNTSLI